MGQKEARAALIVIFGITGDLAKRKLLPALYHLMRDNLLHPDTQIIGVTRQKLTKGDVLAPLDTYTASHARPSPAALGRFKQAFHLLPMDLADGKSYKELKSYLDGLEKKTKLPYQRLYYLSIPPAVFDEVIAFMGNAGLQKAYKSSPAPAVLVEKPFGYDLDSAKELIRSVQSCFDESQVYRIDHYLAKEMAQNIMAFRFTNSLFESVWNRHHIKSVTITAHEKIGIEGRANFYEQTGALRDLMQSHLLQLMSLAAMERPNLHSGTSIHRQRLRLLKSVRILEPYQVADFAVRGQYAGYRREVKNPRSTVETYAALRLLVDNDRWQGVPFLLRTGKAVKDKYTAIEVDFGTNLLVLRLQPDEAISLGLHTKKPGHELVAADAAMDFSYRRAFPTVTSPEAYEKVLLDAVRQDQTLFASSKEVLASWHIIEPVLKEWARPENKPKTYKKGSIGPLSGAKLRQMLRAPQG